MNQNHEPETREQLHRNYRHSISADNSDGNDEVHTRQRNPRNAKKRKHHYGRWITAIIAVLIVIGIFNVGHQINELSNTQRKTDTTLDKVIKKQGEQIAEQKVPTEVKPQVIKIIQTTPLSELQKAANDQALFNQIATNNQIPQQYIQAAQSEWFNANNQELRDKIANGNLLAAYNDFKNEDSTSNASSN